MLTFQIPARGSTANYVTSTDFQANFKEVGYMDYALKGKLEYNKDAPAILAVKHSCRVSIPYGRWTCGDGAEVIFNREYQPMFKRKNDINVFALADEFIEDIVKVEYFYGDHNSPVHYLLRKFKDQGLNGSIFTVKDCKKSLAICLKILEDYYPKNNGYKQSWREFVIR